MLSISFLDRVRSNKKNENQNNVELPKTSLIEDIRARLGVESMLPEPKPADQLDKDLYLDFSTWSWMKDYAVNMARTSVELPDMAREFAYEIKEEVRVFGINTGLSSKFSSLLGTITAQSERVKTGASSVLDGFTNLFNDSVAGVSTSVKRGLRKAALLGTVGAALSGVFAAGVSPANAETYKIERDGAYGNGNFLINVIASYLNEQTNVSKSGSKSQDLKAHYAMQKQMRDAYNQLRKEDKTLPMLMHQAMLLDRKSGKVSVEVVDGNATFTAKDGSVTARIMDRVLDKTKATQPKEVTKVKVAPKKEDKKFFSKKDQSIKPAKDFEVNADDNRLGVKVADTGELQPGPNDLDSTNLRRSLSVDVKLGEARNNGVVEGGALRAAEAEAQAGERLKRTYEGRRRVNRAINTADDAARDAAAKQKRKEADKFNSLPVVVPSVQLDSAKDDKVVEVRVDSQFSVDHLNCNKYRGNWWATNSSGKLAYGVAEGGSGPVAKFLSTSNGVYTKAEFLSYLSGVTGETDPSAILNALQKDKNASQAELEVCRVYFGLEGARKVKVVKPTPAAVKPSVESKPKAEVNEFDGWPTPAELSAQLELDNDMKILEAGWELPEGFEREQEASAHSFLSDPGMKDVKPAKGFKAKAGNSKWTLLAW